MALSYGNVNDVKRLLQVDKGKIKVGQAIEDDITESNFQAFIQDAEDRLTGLLGTRTITTAVGKYIVNRWAAVDIYRSLYPRSSVNEIPAAVLKWADEAQDLFDKVQSGSGESVGAFADWADQL